MNKKLVSLTLLVLSILAGLLTTVGVLLDSGLKIDSVSATILARYPRYTLAMKGLRTLQDMKYPTLEDVIPPDEKQQEEKRTENVGLLTVNDPGFSVLVGFLQSDIATRSSERDDPPSNRVPARKALPDIPFQRVKVIMSTGRVVVRAGGRPLSPPLMLCVIWPESPPVARNMYYFLDWDEFSSDIQQMCIHELGQIIGYCTIGAFLFGMLLSGARLWLSRKGPTAKPAPSVP